MADKTEYFWCLKHHTVETADDCKAADHLGPYPSPQSAAEALDTAARNDFWENDPRFNDEEDDD